MPASKIHTKSKTENRPKSAVPVTPPAHPPADAAEALARRSGESSVARDGQEVPKLPHERDESSTSQSGEPSAVISQAATDLARGLKDSDRGEPMDALYQREFRSPSRSAAKTKRGHAPRRPR